MKKIKHFVYWLIHLSLLIIWHIPSQNIRLLFYKIMWMKIWKKSIIYYWSEIYIPFWISIWNNSIIWSRSVLDWRNKIFIWNNVNFSSEVMVFTKQHDYNSPNFDVKWWSVIIKDNVWIWPRVVILPWVIINEWAVVWAWAVVTKNVDAFTFVWWVPAKEIKKRNKEISYVLNSDWYIPFI